jgi:SAM-dependent methyltransferase
LATIPFRDYAAVYDLIYADKDYAGEAGFVADLCRRFLPDRPVATIDIADVACGTGRHALELARLGFRLEGSDISPDMVDIAKAAAAKARPPIQFHCESFQTCANIRKRFDVVLAMFASIGYLTEWSDFKRALLNIESLLRPGGIFVFDVWNGAAVVKHYSPLKTRRAQGLDMTVERVSRTQVDEMRQIADVRFDFTVHRNGNERQSFHEQHRVRYYFPRELEDLLSALGFRTILRCPFMEPERELRPTDWNMTFIVQPSSSA